MFEINTEAPKKVRASISVTAQDVIDYVDAKLQENGDEAGLPEGATLFLVTELYDEAGDKSTKRSAITPDNGNGTTQFLEIPFYQEGDTRTAIGGRARKNGNDSES